MSENIQSDPNKKTCCNIDGKLISEQQKISWSSGEISPNSECDKPQRLIETANTTFRELCKTLENEQTKLQELEARRQQLQDEMLLLKTEIEEEKKSLNVHIVRSVRENLNALNNCSSINDNGCAQSQIVDENLKKKSLNTYCEEEENQHVTARNFVSNNCQDITEKEGTIGEHVQYIRSELQKVLTQCISEKSGDKH